MSVFAIHFAIACTLLAPAEIERDRSLQLVRPSEDGTHFVRGTPSDRFVVWGLNYDHDPGGRLIEEYWREQWGTVVRDFYEMKDLGANVVRIHLQLPAMMKSATEINEAEFQQLTRLVALAEQAGLYLDITGLGCYHKKAVPSWYDAMDEGERWAVQARFWEAVAKTCEASDAVFCYDLMNEPILPGKEPETEWLAGELGGKHFVQRISLDLAGRTRAQVAKAWVDGLVAAIRRHDKRHMITVGAIPWAHTFPKAEPLFYSKDVGENLDFVSVHFYPEKGEIDKAVDALKVYDVGKPLVVEEMFPLRCSVDDLAVFVERSRPFADGWIGFYWGQTIDEYRQAESGMAGALTQAWLEYFQGRGDRLLPK